MPAKTARMQRFMGSDLARAERGEKTQTGMSKDKLKEMAAKPKGGYPGKKGNGGKNARRSS